MVTKTNLHFFARLVSDFHLKPNAMKNAILACFLAGLLTGTLSAQNSKLPDVGIQTIEGFPINSSTITNDSMPMIMVFWKTYDQEACKHLFSVYETYDIVLRERGVKMIAICTDAIGRTDQVRPFICGHDIDVDVYIDKSGDFKRMMSVSNEPFTILFDDEMNINCQYSGYCAGNEDVLCKKVEECLTAMNDVD
jgi:hypothetical protein